jgi:hypothetical protein
VRVREWFRADRAAMWRSKDHPAHDLAAQLDTLATRIAAMNNLQPGVEAENVWRDRAGRETPPVVLELPLEIRRTWAEQDCVTALEALLRDAWPLADREKYDHTYALLRRMDAQSVWDRATLRITE